MRAIFKSGIMYFLMYVITDLNSQRVTPGRAYVDNVSGDRELNNKRFSGTDCDIT